MDSRLNLAMIESHGDDLGRRAERSRVTHRWPDDGQAPRVARTRHGSLHPNAVLASILTWR